MSSNPTSLDHYVIRGGEAGKRRLDLLARVMQPHTAALLDAIGLRPGARFLDVGCGAGHVSREAARRVGPAGAVTGVDLDEVKLAAARQAAQDERLSNVEFVCGDVGEIAASGSYHFAYARFLLTHLSDPVGLLGVLLETLEPGGVIAVEDIDFSGAFSHPPNPSCDRFFALYQEVVRVKGGDADIGPKLPAYLRQAGFEAIKVRIEQPAYLDGELKTIGSSTLEQIGDAVLAAGVATEEELSATIDGLAAFTADPTTLLGLPRIVQTWGVRPR